MSWPGKDASMTRRFAWPFALSLFVHSLLVLGVFLAPHPQSGSAPGTYRSPFSLSISGPSRPRPRLQPRPAPFRGEQPDAIPVGIEPALVLPRAGIAGDPLPAPTTGPPGGGGILPAAPPQPEPRLFHSPGTARRIVYLLDRSVSMGQRDALDIARVDLIASLRRLSATTHFQIIPYNQAAEPLRLSGQTGLVPAEPPMLDEAIRQLGRLLPSGRTDHLRALRRGLALRPDLLFLATDADDLDEQTVRLVTSLNQSRATIHVIELNQGRPRANSPLSRLARENHGSHRRLDSP